MSRDQRSKPLDLRPLRFGPLEIDFPAVLAPLAGYTDFPTRAIARRLGAPYTVAEVALARFVLHVTKGRKFRRLLRPDDDRPCGAQLMGEGGADLAPAANVLAGLGFDAIDLNLACPVRKVLGKRRGGWLMAHPREAIEMVARLRDGLRADVPLTVKLRRGYDERPESRDRFFEILDGVYAAGAAAVTLHARTVLQRYEGASDWSFLAEVKRRVGSRTLLGSGDLWTAEDCLAMLRATGVDGVSIARGAIGNPWIFGQLRDLAAGRPPRLPELAEQVYGPRRACQVMRKIAIKYSRLHPRATEVRDAFAAAKRPEDWRRALEAWYPAGRE